MLPKAASDQGSSLTPTVPPRRHRRLGRGLLLLLSLLLGWLLAGAIASGNADNRPLVAQAQVQIQAQAQVPAAPLHTVDYVPPSQQRGQQLYLQTCATCHLAVPPEVLPSEAWRNLLQDASHYGVTLQPPRDPARGLIWSYLSTFSRAKSPLEERVPYRLSRSRYFAVLHPDVDLPQPVALDSCQTCHRAAAAFNFRSATTP